MRAISRRSPKRLRTHIAFHPIAIRSAFVEKSHSRSNGGTETGAGSTCENEVITCSTSVPVKPSNPVYLAGSSLSPLIVNQSPAEQQQRMKSRAYGAWSATRTRFYAGVIKAIRLGMC